jgi:spermidine synthase
VAWYFAFFFLSGFCSILYELIWLRLSMAQFGVTTALVSIVLSMFMAGLGAGSLGAGFLVRRFGERIKFPPLRLYAATELLIGCSALVVPAQLVVGHRFLALATERSAFSSGNYYLVSGLIVAFIVVPWCACMGATIPFAMHAIRSDCRIEAGRSFSFLYLSNVVGAVAGALIPLLLIESLGFHGTLRVGAVLNAAIAVSAFGLTIGPRAKVRAEAGTSERSEAPAQKSGPGALVLLFLTGLSTMGMEVIWTREFTPYSGPFVYSFATILASYLFATFLGSALYRSESQKEGSQNPLSWILLGLVGLAPLVTADPRFPLQAPLHVQAPLRVLVGVIPFSLLIGFLTPMLVDRWSAGDPDRAGRAYAVNVFGCILGPLLSGFIFLPLVGEHVSMLLFALPWMVMALLPGQGRPIRVGERVAAFGIVLAAFAIFFVTKDYEMLFPQRRVLRDSTATVIATGIGMDRRLITNGVGMTYLTPVTKMMAHLTLASVDSPPRNALVICFGMGTTYRSVMSWGIPVTAVELVPSVPRLFSFFHSDGDRLLSSSLSHVVIDDGRRYLERSQDKYDAIIIDPPPPIQAAASSLLYSEEFYAVVKEHLQPEGILQQWLPAGDVEVQAAVARALKDSFTYVQVYRSVEGWGWHFLASMRPIPARSASELVARMPAAAVADMMEWGPAKTPQEQFLRVVSTERTPEKLISGASDTPAMRDDRPMNEYYLLRSLSVHAAATQ